MLKRCVQFKTSRTKIIKVMNIGGGRGARLGGGIERRRRETRGARGDEGVGSGESLQPTRGSGGAS